jgi:hypothetical protein
LTAYPNEKANNCRLLLWYGLRGENHSLGDTSIGGIIMKSALRGLAQIVAASAIVAASLATAHAAKQDTERLQQAWRATISRTPVPGDGCFNASYPLLVWHQVRCVKRAKSEFSQMQRTGGSAPAGGSDDYMAVTKSLTSNAVGSFPLVRHVTSEYGAYGPGDYVLLISTNSNLNTPACAGSSTPTYCVGWEQFAFLNLNREAFIQYWMLFYNATCPAGWNAGPTGSCWRNSRIVRVPRQALTELPYLSLSATAVLRGLDTLVMTTRTQAYSTSAPDAVALARGWHGTEFNVVGTSCSTCDPAAYFNAGASLTVKIAVTDGNAQKPTCAANAGTAQETNNLVLGPCTAVPGIGGAPPYIKFTETVPK